MAGNVGAGVGYDLAIANGAAQVFNVGTGSVSLIGDYQYISTTSLTSTGTLTIAPYGNAFTDGSGVIRPFTWSGSGTPNFAGTGSIANLTINNIANLTGLVIGKSSSTANANVAISNAISIAGPISIYGGNITVSGALTTTSGSSGTISLYAADSIMATASITTSGADVLLTSNTDGTAGGSITLNNQTTSTSGGNITLGGGADGSGYAEGSVSALNSVWAYRGIYLNNATVNSAAGNINLRGKGWVGASYTTDNYSLGIDMVIGSVIRSTSGNISMTGLGGTNYKSANHSAGINFCDCGTAISIYSVSGNVSLSGTAGTGTARVYAGINQDSGVTSIYSTSGNVTVTLTDGTGTANGTVTGIGSGVNDIGINIYSGTTFNVGTNVGNSIATSGNVVLQANNFNIAGALNIKNTGTVTLEPISSSFTSALSWPSNINLISTTGLTLGKASNTADVTIGAATSVAGPITMPHSLRLAPTPSP